MKHLGLVIVGVISACGVDPAPTPTAAAPIRVLAPGDRLSVQWSLGVNVDGIDGTTTLACTDVISHPCPFVLYTREVDVSADGASLSWNHGTGGADINGVFAEQRLPWQDPITINDDGSIFTVARSDDAGLRRDTTFLPYSSDVDGAGGYNSEVTWVLANVPGVTHFEVGLTYMPAQ